MAAGGDATYEEEPDTHMVAMLARAVNPIFGRAVR